MLQWSLLLKSMSHRIMEEKKKQTTSSKAYDSGFLDIYRRKIKALRQDMLEFANLNPDIASHLGISAGDIRDPHVERLLEGFCYLTADLEEQIQEGKNRFSSVLSELLASSLTRSIPSSVVLKLNTTNIIDVPKGSVFTTYYNDVDYKVSSAFPIFVAPIEVCSLSFVNGQSFAGMEDQNFVKISLKKEASILKDINSLVLYIDGEPKARCNMYRLLAETPSEKILTKKGPILKTQQDKFAMEHINQLELEKSEQVLTPLGFKHGESLLPELKGSELHHNLICEYFFCLDKFFFFKLNNVNNFMNQEGDFIELYFPVKDNISLSAFDVENLKIMTNCVPCVSLFKDTTKPISFSSSNFEHHLTPSNETDEIYSIEKVFLTSDTHPEPLLAEPYFGSNHWLDSQAYATDKALFWHSRYNDNNKMVISLHGFDYTQNSCVNLSLYTESLLTQPSIVDIPIDSKFTSQGNIGITDSYSLNRSSIFISANKKESFAWRVIAHALINYSDITTTSSDTSDLKKWLGEMICVYSRKEKPASFIELNMISNLTSIDSVAHVGADAWRGFVKGKKITLELKNDYLNHERTHIFIRILYRLFLSKVSVNSFIEMEVLDQDTHMIAYFPPTTGSISLL